MVSFMEMNEASNQIKAISLIIVDIDHTLVEKHKPLTLRAKAVIEKLHKQGVLFGIASGRSLPEIKRMIAAWNVSQIDLIIGLNGSTLWDGRSNQMYEYFKLKKESIQEILALMNPFEHNPIMYRNDQMICGRYDDVVRLSSKTAHMDAIQVHDYSEFYQEDNAKIMFRVNESDMEELERYLDQHSSKVYHAFKTQSTLIEFTDRRCSKAYALQKFCRYHALDPSTVMAFGDTTNDNTMLQFSGLGVCMKNGSDDTKKIADVITEKTCEEDGWAEYMEHHVIEARGW